jgi:Ferritin-like
MAKTVTGIAIEEMLHLALVMNVMTAIGGRARAVAAELLPPL